MKKHGLKKLALNKETLVCLEQLRTVAGAAVTATCASCITCPRTECDCGTNGGSSGHIGCNASCL